MITLSFGDGAVLGFSYGVPWRRYSFEQYRIPRRYRRQCDVLILEAATVLHELKRVSPTRVGRVFV